MGILARLGMAERSRSSRARCRRSGSRRTLLRCRNPQNVAAVCAETMTRAGGYGTEQSELLDHHVGDSELTIRAGAVDSRSEYVARMHRVLEYIERHLDERLELEPRARVANCSSFHLHR